MRKAVMALITVAAAALVGALGAVPAQAAGGVIIYRAYYNSPGSDTGTNASLNAEYIQLRNTARVAKIVTGWTLRDKQGHVYKFPATRINPGQYLTIRTGKGRNNVANRYQGRAWYVWNNTGDTAYLRNAAGAQIDTCSWGRTGSWRNC
jgi:Lamin Tail Domain